MDVFFHTLLSSLLNKNEVFITCALKIRYCVLYVFLRGRKTTPRPTPETIPALMPA